MFEYSKAASCSSSGTTSSTISPISVRPSALAAFGQVLMIDIMLAGDNAIVVGALAAGLPADQRRKVILIGIIAALVLRIVFALDRHAAACRSSA